MEELKTIYYSDPVNDDFAGTNINTKTIDGTYKYLHNGFFYKLIEKFVYFFLLKPLMWVIMKLIFLNKFKNKKVLRRVKRKQGYFVYSNHCLYMGDAFNPSLLRYFRRGHIIVNPDAVSIKGLKTLVEFGGAIPLPGDFKSAVNYKEAIEKYIRKGHVISIYPEAHIWPYYTEIRPFVDSSFRYPLDLNTPVFTRTTIFVKRKLKFIKVPKLVSVIDGPFYPDQSLNRKEAKESLRNQVYNSMKKAISSYPTYKYKFDYVFKEKKD